MIIRDEITNDHVSYSNEYRGMNELNGLIEMGEGIPRVAQHRHDEQMEGRLRENESQDFWKLAEIHLLCCRVIH